MTSDLSNVGSAIGKPSPLDALNQRLDRALHSVEQSVDQIDALTTRLAKEQERRFWDEFGWASVDSDADGNTDMIPEWFKIDFGCPACGSAWGELRAFGFTAPRAKTGVVRFAAHVPLVRLDAPRAPFGSELRAVRLACLDGHVVDFDYVTRRTRVVPPLSPFLMTGLAAAACYLVPMLAMYARKL